MVVAREIAEKEVYAWLDMQGITEKQRELFVSSIERIIDAVQNGYVTINPETNSITQKLKFPFGKEIKITELTYKPQITVQDVMDAKRLLDPEDVMSTTFAHLSAATGELCVSLFKMNNKDFKLCDAIILFFML